MTGVSIISVAMNRNERAHGAVKNWLACDAVAEIVLIDWSSDTPLEIEGDERLRLVRVMKEPNFVLTESFNLAAELATGDVLVKMDIDYRMTPQFLLALNLQAGMYFRGKSSLKIEYNDRFLNGFVALRAEDFWKVGGYNERLYGYGLDDGCLYRRLVESGLKARYVPPGIGLTHLPHPNSTRVRNMEWKDKNLTNRQNRWRSFKQPWTAADKRATFTANMAGHLIRETRI